MKSIVKTIVPLFLTLTFCASAIAQNDAKIEVPQITAETPMETVSAIHEFFNSAEGKVRFQLASPETQYGWQHTSRFYKTEQILRDGPISELPSKPDASIASVKFKNAKGETETVESHLKNFPVDALIVVKDGNIIFERYKTMRPIDKHIWFSSSKITGSTVLALLEHEGKIDVKKPVSNYLAELKGSVWDTVTVEETADMATGLNGTEHDEGTHDERTNPKQIWYQWAVSVGLFANTINQQKTPYEVLATMKRVKPGHTAFEYNSIDTFVVNRIVERVTQRPLAQEFSDRIWRKIGTEHDAYVVVSDQGYSMQFGMINSTLRDFARFGMIFTPSGSKISKTKIIPDAVLKNIQTQGKPEIYYTGYLGDAMKRSFPEETKLTNRYQWDAVFPDGDIYKKGVGGQGLYISPARDVVVAYFCTGTGQDQEGTMARAIAKHLVTLKP
jgi:CubicO group peptidase (beta-lactamase class C family)